MALPIFNFPFHTVRDEFPQNSMTVKYGGGYSFASRPTGPPQVTFHLNFPALWWWTYPDGTIDRVFSPSNIPGTNLASLIDFYAAVECWQPFTYNHPARGARTVRFGKPLVTPKNLPGSIIKDSGMWGSQVDVLQLEFIDQPL